MSRAFASHNGNEFKILPKLPILRQPTRVVTTQPHTNNDSTTVMNDDSANDNILHLGQNLYRLHFSIVDKNRSWMRGTKRSIRWVFGLTNLTSLREGKMGRECRGEEHAVEIVRSKTSGKLRLFWNDCEISRYFRQRHFPLDSTFSSRDIEFSWTTRSGEVLRVVGSVDVEMSDESIRFDLYVDNINFTELSTVGQLGRKLEHVLDQRSPKDESGSQRSLDSSLATEDMDADQSFDLEQGFQLSMVGLNSMTSGEDEINDALHSDLYSDSLTSLRNQIVTCLPQTEEMVSRAIINAFFAEPRDVEPTYFFHSLDEVDCSQIEADYIVEALCWVRQNVGVAPRADVEDLTLQFLQRCVESIFLSIRNEELNSDVAARIVFSVASVLGLEFAVNVYNDTIILEGLPTGISREALLEQLSQFGGLDSFSISSKVPTIAFCRFVFEDSTLQVMAAFERGEIFLNGVQPVIALISMIPSGSSSPLNVSSDEIDDELVLENDINAVSDTMFENSSTLFKDMPVECNNSPTTVISKRSTAYVCSDHRPELETHNNPCYYGSSSTAACY